MTYVIEHYESKENNLTFANIQQDKYSNVFELEVYSIESPGSSIGYTLFRNNYVSVPNARKALKRIGQFERRL